LAAGAAIVAFLLTLFFKETAPSKVQPQQVTPVIEQDQKATVGV